MNAYDQLCNSDSYTVLLKGCADEIQSDIESDAWIIAGVALGVAVIQVSWCQLL